MTRTAIGLPDSTCATTTKCGKVVMNLGLVLTNVLYVPTLSWHFISIGQLVREINCSVIFIGKLCAIRDLASMRLIGVGELRD